MRALRVKLTEPWVASFSFAKSFFSSSTTSFTELFNPSKNAVLFKLDGRVNKTDKRRFSDLQKRCRGCREVCSCRWVQCQTVQLKVREKKMQSMESFQLASMMIRAEATRRR